MIPKTSSALTLLNVTAMLLAQMCFSRGEPFQFFLNIRDLLDPSWPYRIQDQRSRIECATLCFENRGQCAYFGYKSSLCYLLNDTMDWERCSVDDCQVQGMKIYSVSAENTKYKISEFLDLSYIL